MHPLSLTATLLALLANGVVLADASPRRVVSLDYCADQYLLKMLPPTRILAVSPDANKRFSYMRDRAEGIRQVRPIAENILRLEPDLVVRSHGGGPRLANILAGADIAVLQLPYANTVPEIREVVQYIAEQLGVPERGAELVVEMDQRLASINTANRKRTALYMTPTGVTSGPGTLVHEMLIAAGLSNFQQGAGWRSLPLERLAYQQPDLIAAAFFDDQAIHPELWSPMRHPVAKRQLQNQPVVLLRGAWTSCGAWFLLDAIEALAAEPTPSRTEK